MRSNCSITRSALPSVYAIILTLLSIFATHAQSSKGDSLEQVLKTLPADTNRILLLRDLCKFYWYKDTKRSKEYGEEAVQLAKSLKHDRLLADSYLTVSAAYSLSGDEMEALEVLDIAEGIFGKIGDQVAIGRVNNNKGIVLTNMGLYPEALECLQKTLKIYDEFKITSTGSVNVVVNIGTVYDKMGDVNPKDKTDYKLAYDYYMDAYRRIEKFKFEDAGTRDFYFITIQGNIGGALIDLERFEEALKYVRMGLEGAERIQDNNKISLGYQNLALIESKLENYGEAVKLNKKSLEFFRRVGNIEGELEVSKNLGEVYYKMGKYDSAIFYAKYDFKLAEKRKLYHHVNLASAGLSNAFAALKKYDSAFFYQSKHVVAQDSLLTLEKSNIIKSLEVRYELEKQTSENTILKKANENQRNIIVGIAVISLLIALLAVNFFLTRRREQQSRRELDEKNLRIEIQNKELNETINSLRRAQTQLVQSEKMASLGMLTAGIAHEINNPINFISGGVQALEENIFELKKAYANRRDSESNIILSDIGELMGSIKNGVYRTTSIISGLKSFANPDEKMAGNVDVRDCLNSTLVILNSKLRNIEVTKNYEDIPGIACHPGQINQVLLNIIDNAIHAIEETDRPGKIQLKTYAENNYVVISIQDDGPGISEQVQERIFDPFFTTKAIGKGTGLGLSISYNIIREHHGLIELKTQKDTGTEFLIKLPIR